MGNGKLVLVDGAGGYLGRHVVKDLIGSGFRVRATDVSINDLSYAKELGAEIVAADLLDRENLKVAVEGVDYIVHCAALFSLTADVNTLRRVNVIGTENLLRVAITSGVKHFIHISSSDIYGTLKYLPGDEEHPKHPINVYAVSKKEADDLVLQYSKQLGLPVTVLRPSAIYGPGSIYIAGVFFFWPIFMRMLRIPFYPYIRGGSKLTFVHVDDVAGSIRFLLGKPEAYGQAYNLADEEFMYSAAFACKLCGSFGIKNMFPFTIWLPHFLVDFYGKLMLHTSGPILRLLNPWVKKRWLKLQKKYGLDPVFVPHFERPFYSYFIGHRYFSSKKIMDLGFKFSNRSFFEGFPPTFKWYVDNKWLPPVEEIGKKVKD